MPTGATASSIGQAHTEILTRLGSKPISSKESVQFAVTAAHELKLMAMNRSCLYDVSRAIPALKLALQSQNNNVIIAVAGTLGQIRNPEAQRILAHAALNGQSTPESVRYAFYRSLAQSARNLGNHLGRSQIDSLIHEVSHETNAKVRSAAAATLGALNVASNQASKLILKQASMK